MQAGCRTLPSLKNTIMKPLSACTVQGSDRHAYPVALLPPRYLSHGHLYPFSLEVFNKTDRLAFHTPVTFFIGENGTGKSTLLQAIARGSGIHIWEEQEGRRDAKNLHEDQLHRSLRIEWTDGKVPGSFFASEIFRHFARPLTSGEGRCRLPGLFRQHIPNREIPWPVPHGVFFSPLCQERAVPARRAGERPLAQMAARTAAAAPPVLPGGGMCSSSSPPIPPSSSPCRRRRSTASMQRRSAGWRTRIRIITGSTGISSTTGGSTWTGTLSGSTGRNRASRVWNFFTMCKQGFSCIITPG